MPGGAPAKPGADRRARRGQRGSAPAPCPHRARTVPRVPLPAPGAPLTAVPYGRTPPRALGRIHFCIPG